MAQTGTINDLLNKSSLDNSKEEAWVAKKLRQDKRGQIKKIEIKKKITVEVKEKKNSGEKGGAKEKPGEADKGKTKPQAEGEGENKPGGKGEEGGEKPGEEGKGEETPEGENNPGEKGEEKDKPEGGGGPEGKKPGKEGEGGDKPGGKGEEREKPGEKGEGKDKLGEKPEGENKPGKEGGEGEKPEEKPEGEEKPGEKPEGEKPGGKGGEREKPGGRGEGENKPRKKGEGARGQPGNLGGDVDSRLMAGQLREEKNKERERREAGGKKGEEAEKGAEGEEAKEGEGWGDRIRQLKEKANLKERAKKKLEEKTTAPAKQGTNRLLRWAWMNLIDSFGATLLYINLHVFLRMVLGEKLFCKLGEEWIPKEVQAVGGEAGETGGKAIGLVEVIGLLILDLIALFIIGSVLALIVMIVDFMEKGLLGKAGAIIGGLTGLGWSGVKALFDLF